MPPGVVFEIVISSGLTYLHLLRRYSPGKTEENKGTSFKITCNPTGILTYATTSASHVEIKKFSCLKQDVPVILFGTAQCF
jgi:hypothetical protein